MGAEAQMPWRRSSRVDPDRSEVSRTRHPRRGEKPSSRGRQLVPCVECLEGRRLLTAITEYPISPGDFTPRDTGALTVGPDGNLWFPETIGLAGSGYATEAIVRVTTSGVVDMFPL